MSTVHEPRQLRMTVADFLAWPGDGTAKRYQLVEGEPQAMAPASTAHGAIQAQLAYLITRCLIETGRPCRAVTEPAVAPRLRANVNLRVPGIGVTCTPIEPGQVVLTDPVLLVEILPPGNEPDTWENVWTYATIPSVQEILVVHSTRIAAELLRRCLGPRSPKRSGGTPRCIWRASTSAAPSPNSTPERN